MPQPHLAAFFLYVSPASQQLALPQAGTVQRIHAAQQQRLTQTIDALLGPVHGGGAAVPGGEVTHGHVAAETEHKYGDQCLLLHLRRDDAETPAHAAVTQYHHGDEHEGAGEQRRRHGQGGLPALPRQHQYDAEPGQQLTQGLGGQEHGVEHMEIAHAQRVQEFPQRLEKTGQENVDAASGETGKGVLGHLAVQVALHQHGGDAEQKHGDEIDQGHRDRELIYFHGAPLMIDRHQTKNWSNPTVSRISLTPSLMPVILNRLLS